MRTVVAGVWLNISEGAELRCTVQGSDEASVTIGESRVEHELTFDYATFRELVTQADQVLVEMEAKAAEEEAEWEAEQAKNRQREPGSD